MFEPWIIAPISALISIIVGVYFYYYVKKQDSGTKRMQEIAAAIEEGANAFIRREYMVLAIFVAVVAVLLCIFLPEPLWQTQKPIENVELTLAYIFGSFCSALAGVIGLRIATKANTKAANAAREGLNKAFPIGFRGGAVMGLAVVGAGLLGISIVYAVTGNPEIVLGYSFGASSLALFAKAGGGIYTKTADISADLVGKVELGIPEDDPRNPAVIADNVGDNVGDVAGMGADLFDSYVASIVAVMILGEAIDLLLFRHIELYTIIPLVFAGLGVIAAVLGALTVRVGRKGNPGRALNMGTYITCVIFAVLTFSASYYLQYNYRIWGATIVGLIAGIIIGMTSDYFTSEDKPPVKKTAEASLTGTATNIITGFSYGLHSVFPPLVGIGIASAIAFFLCGPIGGPMYIEGEINPQYVKFALYGIGMAAVGMLSIVGLIVSNDAYGPIVDNSRGIAMQGGLSDEVIRVTDEMDAAGNTAKAITKGFAIGAAGLTVIALLAAFQERAQSAGVNPSFNLMNPLVLLGALIGIAMPAVFSAMVMLGVGRNAFRMIEEIRRQFNEIPGLREGKEGIKPDYARCVDIATVGAIKELMPASLVAIGVTLIVGFVGGIEALGGYLAGTIFSGLLFALLMANAGGLWDNAKKLIESGEHGGKGSEAHKAAVVGDTVGDPFKDTAGPSLNTMITVMSLVASLFAVLIANYNLLKLLGL
ncbi:MAG: sodium-translocating pyrophosphatase [Candidatus Bathyarchaeota archaeon]|jgi:K(+)-stimulated pyrophosphate-energized sodium pump|nr:sodium-translocating pyrophosphatase [Candidatus Bathyarchaeota archaeon]